MNVILLSQFFSVTKGGGEYVFSVIAKELAKNNHNVYVITNKVKDEEYPDIKNLKIIPVEPQLEYQGGIPPSFSDNIRYFFNALSAARKIARGNKIDLIHSNNFSPALVGSVLSIFTSIPHITTVHDVFSLCGRNYWKQWADQANVSWLNVKLAPLFEKLMTRLKHDCVHTVSQATKDDLIKFGEKKPIHIIENAIEDAKTIQQDVNPNQFIYVGRLVFYKNIEVIIKAVNILKENNPRIKLVIAGGGPQKKILEDMTSSMNLKENIDFRGFVGSQEKMRLIAESNAMLFPSLCEGFGLVILEAFQQKRPVLASNIPPMSDIIEDKKTGFLIDPYNERDWSERISSLITDTQTSKIMGENGYQTLQEKYNQDVFYQKLINMYKLVLQT